MSDTKLNFSQCANAKGDNSEELPSYAAQMAEALNSPGCATSSSSTEWQMKFGGAFAAKRGPLMGGGVVGGTAGGVTTATETLGCEQIMQIAQRNYDTTEKIKCVLSQTSTAIKTLSQNINKINFESKNGRLVVDCPDGLDLSQAIDVKINNSNQYADSQIQDITDTLTNAAELNVKSAMDSKQGWAATAQGQKTLAEALAKTQSSDFKQQVRQTVIDITSELKGANEINFVAGGDVLITGKQCKITQDAVVEIVAQTMINSVMQNTFKDTKETAIKIITEAAQKSEAEGAPTLTGGLQNIVYIIIGVIILLVILGVMYYFMTKSSDEKAPTSSPTVAPTSAKIFKPSKLYSQK